MTPYLDDVAAEQPTSRGPADHAGSLNSSRKSYHLTILRLRAAGITVSLLLGYKPVITCKLPLSLKTGLPRVCLGARLLGWRIPRADNGQSRPARAAPAAPLVVTVYAPAAFAPNAARIASPSGVPSPVQASQPGPAV